MKGRLNTFYNAIDLDALRECCMKHGVKRLYEKGELFLKEGKICSKIALIDSGYFKYTVTDSKGRRHVAGFVFEQEFVADFSNSISGLPSQISIEAGKNSEVSEISIDQFKEMVIERFPEMEMNIMHVLFRAIYTRFLDLYRMTPTERYEQILTSHPALLREVPLRDIASYLQVSPIHLSRIRKAVIERERRQKTGAGKRKLSESWPQPL